jgi:N-methylhydantoinase A
MRRRRLSITIDIDTGGTFTDGFVFRDGRAHVVKVLTTPHDLAVCFRDVIEGAAGALGSTVSEMLRETVSVRYATTVGTNAVIQRKGPRLGLIAGPGLPAENGRDHGVGLFVDAQMVRRRTVADADAAGAPEREGTLSAVRELLDDGARGIVAALGAGAGGEAGERRARELFAEHYPHTCLDTVPLLLASEITSDRDDARRTATALFNAYVHPDVADYLYRAEDYLRDQGYRRPLMIVHNDGGCARVAKTVAAKTYNSGPMAGLLGGRAIARLYGLDTLVTLDMGGTSLDIGIVREAEVPMLAHGRVEGVEVAFPLPDLVPLGAGGGSIAWLDGEELRVGPRSAGAKPGPACFGFGGEEPTLTDADVVLGILRPEAFLGGSMAIDIEAARRALQRIAEPLGCDVQEAAWRVRATVHEAIGERLAGELRARGVDPSAATVLAFGGNGATHCAGIAQAAGIRDVMTLPFSPVFSAFGASTADVRHRYEVRADQYDEQALRVRALRDMRGEGFGAGEVQVEVLRSHREGMEWVTLEATRELPHVDLARIAAAASANAATEPEGSCEVRWLDVGVVATPVHSRDRLGTGTELRGPALVDSATTTCAVPPGWTLVIDEHGAERLSFDGRGQT